MRKVTDAEVEADDLKAYLADSGSDGEGEGKEQELRDRYPGGEHV